VNDARLQKGEAVRRAMFGDELVDRNYVEANDFNRPVQDWLAGAVWADVWTRDGIDRRTRSLVTVGILAALNRPDELAMHVGAARANGCSIREIQEILLQVAPYCGAPAALSAFRIAERVLDRVGAPAPSDAFPDER
jgi:4-carboxymuconolactone decarboxylase